MRGSVGKKRDRWYICYYIGKDASGKWRQQWEDSWDTKREAEKVLRVRMEELESTFGCSEDSSTTEAYLRYWLRVYCESRLACNTVCGHRVNLEKCILPYIGKIPLKRPQPRDIQELYETRRKSGLSGTTVRYLCTCSMYF